MPAMLGTGRPGDVGASPVMVNTRERGADMAQGTCSVEGCERQSRRAAAPYCNAHYERFRRTGDLRSPAIRPRRASLDERLAQFVIQPSGCWEWTGSKNDKGYGRVYADRDEKRAHRAMWEQAHGPVPDGLWVLHRCDNPPCVNPDHLFLGTPLDNVRDMMAKGRHWMASR